MAYSAVDTLKYAIPGRPSANYFTKIRVCISIGFVILYTGRAIADVKG